MTIAIASIYEDVYAAIRTLLIANKPTYTYKKTEFEYNITAEFPRDNPSFPLIVLNKAMINITLINLDRSGENYDVEVQMDLFAKELHGKVAIDKSLSQLMNTFINNFASLESDNSLIPNTEDFWEVSNNSTFEEENQILNTVSAIVRFKLK